MSRRDRDSLQTNALVEYPVPARRDLQAAYGSESVLNEMRRRISEFWVQLGAGKTFGAQVQYRTKPKLSHADAGRGQMWARRASAPFAGGGTGLAHGEDLIGLYA